MDGSCYTWLVTGHDAATAVNEGYSYAATNDDSLAIVNGTIVAIAAELVIECVDGQLIAKVYSLKPTNAGSCTATAKSVQHEPTSSTLAINSTICHVDAILTSSSTIAYAIVTYFSAIAAASRPGQYNN